MKNYEAVHQWAASVNAEKAFNEIQKLRDKYPWLKCDESFLFITRMHEDLPKIINIVKLQEKQNSIHRKFVEVSQMADAAIVTAVQEHYGIKA